MSNRILLDDSRIVQFANNSEIVKEFPIFKSALKPPPVKRSGCCPIANTQTPTFRIIKQAVIAMPKDRVNRLKELAGAKQFVVIINKGSKAIKEHVI